MIWVIGSVYLVGVVALAAKVYPEISINLEVDGEPVDEETERLAAIFGAIFTGLIWPIAALFMLRVMIQKNDEEE